MAYKLKYYGQVTTNGVTSQLNIYQRDYTGSAMILGTLQSLSLGYVGNASIEAAIIKSELTFSLVDAWKETDWYDSTRKATVKMSGWEEFYTSDAMLYKVELTSGGTARWTGYLTPDSFEEDLVYGGSVSFVARDMIGHLSDFDFDMTSDTSELAVGDIIAQALTTCGAAMSANTTYLAKLKGSVTASGTAYAATAWVVNEEAFEGETWYDVLEALMDSLGATIRWNDDNTFLVCPLRYLPEASRTTKEVQFVTSGHRAMDPAIRKIVETFSYKTASVFEPTTKAADYTATSLTIKGKTESNTFVPSSSSPWKRSGNIGMYSPFSFNSGNFNDINIDSHTERSNDGEKDTTDLIFISNVGWATSDPTLDAYIYRTIEMAKGSIPLSVAFTLHDVLGERTATMATGIYSITDGADIFEEKIHAHWEIIATLSDGSKKYGDSAKGAWYDSERMNSTTATSDSGDTSEDVSFMTPKECTSIEFRFYGITINGNSILKAKNSMNCQYGVISGFKIEQSDTSTYEAFTTRTIYNEKNNVIYERSPKLGQVPLLANCKVVNNGFYCPDKTTGYSALQLFRFDDESTTARLSALVHKEIIMFYDHPNNELTGELIDKTSKAPNFGNIWNWNSTDHLLIGGKLNLMTGRITSSVLREYVTWSSLWSGISVTPTTISATASATTKTITIKVTDQATTWEVKGLPAWITASVTSKTGDGTTALTIAANDSYTDSRTASFTIAGIIVKVTQSAKTTADPTWNGVNQSITADAQELDTLIVQSNGSTYTIEASQSWIHLLDCGNDVWTATAEENETTSARTAYISLKVGSTNIKNITISQEAGQAPVYYDVTIDSVTPEDATITMNGTETTSLSVKGGSSVTIVASAEGYWSQTIIKTITEDTDLNISLRSKASTKCTIGYQCTGCHPEPETTQVEYGEPLLVMITPDEEGEEVYPDSVKVYDSAGTEITEGVEMAVDEETGGVQVLIDLVTTDITIHALIV